MLRESKSNKNFKYPAQEYSRTQEKNSANDFGGSVTVGSGNKRVKGDVRFKGLFRLESKATSKRSYSLKFDDLEKIENVALSAGELAFFQVDFIDSEKKPIKKVIVLPEYVFQELLDAYKQSRGITS